MLDRLLRNVSEGLTYVKHVEETLNVIDECLSNPAQQVNTTNDIVQWFSDTAKNMLTEVESKNMKGSDDNSVYMLASSNSMYRLTQTILVSYHDNIDQVSQEELLVQLSPMISKILAACLTNLPQVIAMKCHTSVIEKREASVQTGA
ncbi:hypothetical protein Hanom_Chr08g00708001 [Helianthus anomalus]